MTALSNHLTELADRVAEANTASAEAEKSAIEKALESGRLLVEARAECKHGQWFQFIDRTGISERQAQRLMQLARSGLKPDTVSGLGGIKAALSYCADRTPPKPGQCVLVHINMRPEVEVHASSGGPAFLAGVWHHDRAPGFYQATVLHFEPAVAEILWTKRPVKAPAIWWHLERMLDHRSDAAAFKLVRSSSAAEWIDWLTSLREDDQ